MKKAIMLFSVLTALFLFSGYDMHVTKRGEVTREAVTPAWMTERLVETAEEYKKYAPVPRVAVYNFAFAATLDEYRKLNTFGVIMISAQCRDGLELPLKEVYYLDKNKRHSLICFFSRPFKTQGDLAEMVIGKNRIDSYYLVPYPYSRMKGRIYADWNKNRRGFVVAKLPAQTVLEFIKDKKDLRIDGNKKVDADALEEFLKREFAFSGKEAAEAAKNAAKANWGKAGPP